MNCAFESILNFSIRTDSSSQSHGTKLFWLNFWTESKSRVWLTFYSPNSTLPTRWSQWFIHGYREILKNIINLDFRLSFSADRKSLRTKCSLQVISLIEDFDCGILCEIHQVARIMNVPFCICWCISVVCCFNHLVLLQHSGFQWSRQLIHCMAFGKSASSFLSYSNRRNYL